MHGANGRILWADLTKKEFHEEEIPEDIYRKYLTGYGLGAYILNREMKAGADPLGPDNVLGFLTGFFNSLGVPLGGRFEVVAKSPMTNTWGDSNCGGKFGPELKNAGFDALFVKGISEKPVYITIIDGKYSMEDASEIWGKDTYETEEYLQKIDKKGQSAVIGVPGEKMLYSASIMNEYGRAAGRSGLGAVMGSKKLKAVFARGTKKFEAHDPALLAETIKEIQTEFRNNIDLAKPWQLFGTTELTEASHLTGDAPIKNWAGIGVVDFGEENAKKINGEEIKKDKIRSYGCSQCTLACGGHIKRNTKYGVVEGHRLEYEGTASFGGLNLNHDLDAMTMCFEICNRAGTDIITVGAAIAFANECYEKGILTKEDIGFEIGFGKPDEMVKLTQIIAEGDGIGAILGNGAKYAAEAFGKGSEQFAMHVLGQDLPMHDPKLYPSLATTYLADPTPGRHTAGGIGFNEGGTFTLPFKYKHSEEEVKKYQYSGKGELQALSAYGMQVMNATGMCQFSTEVWANNYPYSKLFKAIMGWKMTPDEIVDAGHRIQILRHLFNYKEGINQRNIEAHGRMVGNPPQDKGPVSGITVDYKLLVSDYLDAVGLDEKGRPTDKTIEELGIERDLIQ